MELQRESDVLTKQGPRDGILSLVQMNHHAYQDAVDFLDRSSCRHIVIQVFLSPPRSSLLSWERCTCICIEL